MTQFPINGMLEGVSIVVVTSQQIQWEVVGNAEDIVAALNRRATRFQTFKTPDGGLLYLNTDHIVRVVDGPIGGLA